MKGQPLEGVRVAELGQSGADTKTAEDGFFNTRWGGAAVLVEHDSFAPVFLVPHDIKKGSSLDLRLIPRPLVEWKVPPCSRVAEIDDNPLKRLRLRFPMGLKKTKVNDSDYEQLVVSSGKTGAHLRFWKRVVSSGLPAPKFFSLSSERIATRPISVAGTRGYDVRSTSAKGRVSRWMGVFYTYLVYEDVELSTAKLFDSVIGGACYY